MEKRSEEKMPEGMVPVCPNADPTRLECRDLRRHVEWRLKTPREQWFRADDTGTGRCCLCGTASVLKKKDDVDAAVFSSEKICGKDLLKDGWKVVSSKGLEPLSSGEGMVVKEISYRLGSMPVTVTRISGISNEDIPRFINEVERLWRQKGK